MKSTINLKKNKFRRIFEIKSQTSAVNCEEKSNQEAFNMYTNLFN